MNESFYTAANKTIRIESEIALNESPYTLPFKTEKTSDADISCTVAVADRFENADGVELSGEECVNVYRVGDLIYTDSYLHDRKTLYARSVCGINGGDIRLDLLSSRLGFASDTVRIMAAMNLYFALLKENVAVLHSSSIEYGGKAVLFTAPSNTGKSTQASLWEKYRGAKVLNGDKNCVTVSDGALAHGIPFCGTSGITNRYTLPLGAVVVLKHGEENTVRRLKGIEALTALTKNSMGYSQIGETMLMLTDIYIRLLDSVPVFELKCTPDERAVNELEKALMR